MVAADSFVCYSTIKRVVFRNLFSVKTENQNRKDGKHTNSKWNKLKQYYNKQLAQVRSK